MLLLRNGMRKVLTKKRNRKNPCGETVAIRKVSREEISKRKTCIVSAQLREHTCTHTQKYTQTHVQQRVLPVVMFPTPASSHTPVSSSLAGCRMAAPLSVSSSCALSLPLCHSLSRSPDHLWVERERKREGGGGRRGLSK